MTDMKNKKSSASSLLSLHQKAEALWATKHSKLDVKLTEIETLKLIHELEVYQIELELQNEELVQTKKLADALASARYAELYNLAPSGYFTISDKGFILEQNLCAVQMMDSVHSISKESRFDLYISKESKPVFNQFLDQVFSIRTKVSCEVALVVQRGKPAVYLHLTGVVAGGRKECLVTAVDITTRKEAEGETRLAAARLQRIIDLDVIGVIIANADGNVIDANNYYLGLIGYSRQEFLEGKVNWRSITPTEWLPSDEYAIRELREKGICTPYEKEYLLRDGTRKAVLITDALLPGQNEQILGFVLDITERKRIQDALRESNELLS